MKALTAIATGVLIMTSPADAAPARPAVQHFPRSTLNGQPLPFSSAVRIGDILYLSGQMGFREDGALGRVARDAGQLGGSLAAFHRPTITHQCPPRSRRRPSNPRENGPPPGR